MVLCPIPVRDTDPANDNGTRLFTAIVTRNARLAHPVTRESVLEVARWFEDNAASPWTRLLMGL